jgi:hypothetical protein
MSENSLKQKINDILKEIQALDSIDTLQQVLSSTSTHSLMDTSITQ